MENNQMNQSNQLIKGNLTDTVKDLNTTLQAIQPSDNQTTRLITYALIATAITGIFVYHYIKNQEQLD
jgi:hypothetical protein